MKTKQSTHIDEVKASHTPGPWRVILAPTQIVTDDAIVASVNMLVGDETRFANARLIASAPEMLEALEALNSALAQADINWENNRELAVLRRDAFNVIAKAEGRS